MRKLDLVTILVAWQIVVAGGAADAHVGPDEFRLLTVDPEYVVEISESHAQYSTFFVSGSTPSVRFRVLARDDEWLVVGLGDGTVVPCPGQTARGAELFEAVISRAPQPRIIVSLRAFEASVENNGELKAFYRDNLPAVFEYTENCELSDRMRLIYHEQEIDWATGRENVVDAGTLETIAWYTFLAGDTPLAVAARESHEDIEVACADAPFKELLLDQFQENSTCGVSHLHRDSEVVLQITARSASTEIGTFSYALHMGYLYEDSNSTNEGAVQ